MATMLSNVSIKDSSSWNSFLDLIYPIGSLYFAYSATSPATRFGGTWTAITGRFIYANAGTGVGGANSYTLSAAQLPSHTHQYTDYHRVVQQYQGLASMNCVSFDTQNYQTSSVTTAARGSGSSINNMPAYQTVYCWRRTA